MAMRRVCAAVQVLSGVISALIGTAAISYLGLFYVGLSDVLSIDVAPKWHHPGLFDPRPLLNNLLLLLLFTVSHSVFARQWVKDVFSVVFKMSPSLYRQFYFFQSSFFTFLLCYGWSPQPTTVWDVQFTPIRYTLYGVGTLGILLTAEAFRSLPVLDFFGIEEPLQQLTGRSKEEVCLITSGVYGCVRHPMYTGLVISVCSHPTMTVSRLLIAIALVTYLLVSVPYLEERDLVTVFGGKYRNYIRTTPMLFPISFPNCAKKRTATE